MKRDDRVTFGETLSFATIIRPVRYGTCWKKLHAQRGRQMQHEIEELREKAARCRELADAQANVGAVSQLLALAFEYDSRAEKLGRRLRPVGRE
jgi:hypothetical protein